MSTGVDSTAEALLQEAKALHAAKRLAEAARGYGKVLELNPANFDATHMLGVIALQIGDAQQAIAFMSRAIELNPGHAQAQANLGTAYSLANRLEEAVRAYDRALALDPRFAGAFRNRGTMLQRMGRHDEAAESFKRLEELAPETDFALGSLFESRRYGCDWRDFHQHVENIVAGVAAGRNVDRPFSFLSVCGSAAAQRECAKVHAAYLCPAAPPPIWRGECYSHSKIRVAYVSADYRDHVVLRLITPLLEAHDKHRFHVMGVSLVADDDSEILKLAKGVLGDFINVSRMNDEVAAGTIRDMEVDIAVDLTGYTAGCRPGIFARRPAPVQVNFLGFPGTMGSTFMDYIIADDFVAPDSSSAFFSENLVRMPDTFHITGQRRMLLGEPETPSRSEVGLPDAGMVFCAFSNSYKLNPEIFDTWARVMVAAPGSVLWLLGEVDAVRRRLRAEAAARGVGPERLVFAGRVHYAQHLVRLRLADLFLDTLPFNAGVTASDALWAGLPVLTCAGESFAARMAGSVLRAAGLPELITFNLTDYERRAIELALDPGQLTALKRRLAANRLSQPLFDMNRHCRHLEAAYTAMCERSRRGDCAAGFDVPAIAT